MGCRGMLARLLWAATCRQDLSDPGRLSKFVVLPPPCPPQVLLGVTTPLPEHNSGELRELLAAMLQQDPTQRITMPQLLAHPAVAPRLAQLQAQGLVGLAPAGSAVASAQQVSGAGVGVGRAVGTNQPHSRVGVN